MTDTPTAAATLAKLDEMPAIVFLC